jgi:hypothetical protein
VRTDKKSLQKSDKKTPSRIHKRGVVGYSKKSALLEAAITQMNTGKYGRSSAALKELLSLDPHNTEARRLFATLHLRLGSLVTARQAFESLANEAIGRQDFWLAESLLREYLAAGPRCVLFLELLAHVYEEKGDGMAAVAELGKAIDILIESPDSENPSKPSQLYAKVRELAPASAVAFQFASLFDIQTGELLVPQPVVPTSSEVDAPQPSSEILAKADESKASDVMPWEQFDGAFSSQETTSPTSSNSVVALFDGSDVLVDPVPADLDSQDQNIPPSESAGLSQEANQLDADISPSTLEESSFPSSENCNEGMEDSIVERSRLEDEGPTPSSSDEHTANINRAITSSDESSGLSSPMPWEQIENSTINIEETAPPPTPPAQSKVSLSSQSVFASSAIPQPEPILLSEPIPVRELTEAGELILATEPLTSPAALEPEVSTLSTAHSTSTVPFSWNTVVDDAWKFATGTLSSSSPDEFLKPSVDSRELESVQPEAVTEQECSTPSITSEPSKPFGDSEPLSVAFPSTLSEVSGPIAETDAIRESDLPTAARFLEQPSGVEESLAISSEVPSKVDFPVPPLSEPVELIHEPESISFTSIMEPKTVSAFPRVSASEPSCSAVIPEALPAPESVSIESHESLIAPIQTATASSNVTAPNDTSESAAKTDAASAWNTGEVEVQPHRPSEKKRNWDREKGEVPDVPPTSLPPVGEFPEVVAGLSRSGGWESAPSEGVVPIVEAVTPIIEEVVPREDIRPEWVRTSESITFVNHPPSSPIAWQDSSLDDPEPANSVIASAVDVLFDSTGEKSQVRTHDRLVSTRPRPRFAAKMARVRIGISSFIGSCFSTTRSIVLLCVGLVLSCVILVAIGIGAVGLAWMVMESPPSPVYHNLTASPPRAMTDSTKNGYFLLLGFDVSSEQDPLQAGYGRRVEEKDIQAASACMFGDKEKGTTAGASTDVLRGWFTSVDPLAQLKPQAALIRSWVAQESLALKRYQQWLSMSFEDAGYGQILSPNCAHILLAHRLYLAEGFEQDLNTGLGRLENDMRAWRTVLGQSKTLMVKMLAVAAVQDEAAIASGLLTHQDLDQTAIGRLGKIVRPLDQVELSLRWPMQSHLVWATKTVTKSLKNDKSDERPLYVALAAAMPLPIQRRSNAYADYYEAANKAVAEGRYTNLPKPSTFIRTPALSAVDYMANPIEHIIGIEPLPSWDPYVGRTMETDARLRLASLQAWIRQGAKDGNVVTRLAKAGQAHYDPFTGLPMLVDQQRGLMYSVGQDGKDQEGDPLRDVVVTIPKTQSTVIESSRSVPSFQSK